MNISSHRLRTAATVAAGALALSVLAACGSEDDGKTTAPKAEGCEAAPAAETSDETRTVTDTYLGDVENVPTHPQRVLALWRVGSELADLCVVAVGALDGEFIEDEIDPARWADFDDVPVVGSFEGVDVEKVIELEPDLIIGMDHGGLSINYDELKEIAPTVILPIAEPTDVWANYPKVADLVGLTTDYEEKKAQLDADLAAIADEYGDKLDGVQATALNFGDTLYVSTSKSLTYQRLDAAGFGYNDDYVTNPERYVDELKVENLADLNDQDIIFFDADENGNPTPEMQAILDQESFKRLPAVQAGNLFPMSSGVNYTFAAADAQVADIRAAAEGYQPQ